MLRLLTFLSPGIPIGFYESIGDYLTARLDIDVDVASDPSRSGPGPGTANPFGDGTADVGFVCAPSYTWMAAQNPALVELAGVAPVHSDPRNGGRAEYYAELVVHAASDFQTFEDLAGQRFAYNDLSSLSGYHCVLDKLAASGRDADFFGEMSQSGSHQQSIELLIRRDVDLAAIDANVLHFMQSFGAELPIRIVETLGPFPVQPVIFRASLAESTKHAVTEALLEMHLASGGEPLRRFGVQRFAVVHDDHYDSVRSRLR